MRKVDIKGAAALLQAGGIIIYQTETFCAIGAAVFDARANEAICRIKQRPKGKPLPVLATSLGQAETVADFSNAPRHLIANFWPGALSVVLPAKSGLAPALLDQDGNICIRATSCQNAAKLALAAGSPISASSANFSGCKPCHSLAGLDREFLRACGNSPLPSAILMEDDDQSQAGSPSTIVKFARAGGKWSFEIIRPGAVPAKRLESYLITK